MRLILTVTILIGLLSAALMPTSEHNILLLQKANKIELSIIGNAESTHYLEPILLTVTNKTNKKIEINIPPGLHFATVDSNYQDVISTQERTMLIAANASKTIAMPGLCIQNHNSAPGGKTEFTLGAMALDKTLALAEFLDLKNIQGSQAQQAMWVLTDNNNLTNIIGFDDRHEQELLDKTADLAGLPKISIEDYKELKNKRHNPVYTSSLKGYFKFEFPRKTRVQIAIFNQDHVLIKEVFNQEVEAGFHKVEYKLETTDYEGKKIISQMIAYNKVVSKRTIDLRGR